MSITAEVVSQERAGHDIIIVHSHEESMGPLCRNGGRPGQPNVIQTEDKMSFRHNLVELCTYACAV